MGYHTTDTKRYISRYKEVSREYQVEFENADFDSVDHAINNSSWVSHYETLDDNCFLITIDDRCDMDIKQYLQTLDDDIGLLKMTPLEKTVKMIETLVAKYSKIATGLRNDADRVAILTDLKSLLPENEGT